MIDERYVYLGALLGLFGQIRYITETIQGKVKPNRVTWILWALIPGIALSAQIKEGVGISSLMTFMVGFGPLCVFLASFVNKKAYWKISRLDITCGILSILGVALWLNSNNGNLAILFSIIADFVAGIPTLTKAYFMPETESDSAFLFASVNSFITMLTLKTWDFAHAGFPVYIFFICTILVLLIRFKLGKRQQILQS